ncbi:MAG: DUF2382 domain-containing protein [Rubrobacter sp.]|nr:DUF2382 domain-containing protein [Rubrobacter sp.]MBA4115190.1 DUF2382 domain-containing protein [Rubrobacter sp.]
MGKERSDELGKRLAGYQIYDRHYEKVGKVDGLFVDENDELEYIGVKTGLFGGSSVLIPMEIVRVNDARRLVEVAAEKKAIKEGPSFGDDAEITTEFEDRVYTHFGVRRGAFSQDSGGYGAHHGGGSSVDLAYGERADAQTASAPETHEGHELREREEEPDATDPARRKARELGVDLAQLEGTGSGGRIIVSDVTESAERGQPTDQPVASSIGPEPAHAGEGWGHAEPDAGPREGDLLYDQDIGAEYQETGSGGTGYASEDRRGPRREEAGEVGPGMSMGDTDSGEFRGHASDDEGIGQRHGSDLEDEDELRVQRSEEELRVGTREREAGSVNVRKRVYTDRERLSVPIRREEVTVERVPVEGGATEAQIGAEEVTIPVVEDEVVVEKHAVVKEEIRVRKDVVHEQQIVEEDVRREEVEVEDATTRREE